MLAHYFDFQGRIGRKDYFLNMLVAALLGGVVCTVVMVALVFLYQVAPYTSIALGIIAALGYIGVSCLFGFSQAAKRAHDLGHPSWFALLLCVPALGFLFALYLFFAPAEETVNAFGARHCG